QTHRPFLHTLPLFLGLHCALVQQRCLEMHFLPHRFLFLGQGAAAASSGDEKPSRLVSVPAITPLSTRRELIMRVRASKRTVSMSRPPRRSEMSSFHCRERSDVAHGENCVFSRTNVAPTIEQ